VPKFTNTQIVAGIEVIIASTPLSSGPSQRAVIIPDNSPQNTKKAFVNKLLTIWLTILIFVYPFVSSNLIF